MGKTARQFNKMYMDYKKKFKIPINQVANLMNEGFTDEEFVDTFKRLYPHLWNDIEKNYQYWHKKNNYLINHGKKSRYNFRKPSNFVLDCSFGCRQKLRKSENQNHISYDKKRKIEEKIIADSKEKLRAQRKKMEKALYYIQEIEPKYTSKFIDRYFKTHDLHEKLEIIRELSKFKSDNIISFFYKVNACSRNHSLKKESMKYIQGFDLPFVLRKKKKGKKNFIDNEHVVNNSSPDILMKRLYVDELEKIKNFDVFLSHNSKDEEKIVGLYKRLNKKGYVAYVDWVNDKFDLKREWCNISTSQVIKRRIQQSQVFILFLSDSTLKSQWCPWELGYADALGKPICIYMSNFDENSIPQFYKGYPRLCFEKNIMIYDEDTILEFDKWFKSKNRKYVNENNLHRDNLEGRK